MKRAVCLLLLTLGCGGRNEPASPDPVNSGPSIGKLLVGGAHSCVWTEPHLRCWGANDHGQLLVGDTEPHVGAVLSIHAEGASSIALGLNSTAWVMGETHSFEWEGYLEVVSSKPSEHTILNYFAAKVIGGATADYYCIYDIVNEYACFGSNIRLQFSQEGLTFTGRAANQPEAHDAVDLAVGGLELCARFSDHVACRGEVILDDRTSDHIGWTVVPGLSAPTSLSNGSGHRCAVSDSSLYCWGENDRAQLGVSGDRALAPQRVSLDVQTVAAGGNHTCAILRNGEVACWGANDSGQTGAPPSKEPVVVPKKVSGLTDVVQLALGMTHSCAMKGDGSVWCWGANDQQQLGMKSGGSSYVPVRVELPPL